MEAADEVSTFRRWQIIGIPKSSINCTGDAHSLLHYLECLCLHQHQPHEVLIFKYIYTRISLQKKIPYWFPVQAKLLLNENIKNHVCWEISERMSNSYSFKRRKFLYYMHVYMAWRITKGKIMHNFYTFPLSFIESILANCFLVIWQIVFILKWLIYWDW